MYVGTEATPTDATHFNPAGATVIAGLVTSEMTSARLPFAAFLRQATDSDR